MIRMVWLACSIRSACSSSAWLAFTSNAGQGELFLRLVLLFLLLQLHTCFPFLCQTTSTSQITSNSHDRFQGINLVKCSVRKICGVGRRVNGKSESHSRTQTWPWAGVDSKNVSSGFECTDDFRINLHCV